MALTSTKSINLLTEIPGPRSQELVRRREAAVLNGLYKATPLAIERGQGALVTDVDGNTLTIASVSSGAGGTAVLNLDGTVTFTPAANFNGAANFTYTVSDGTTTSNTGMVTVNVDSPTQDIVVGVVLVAAVGLDSWLRQRRA